MYHPDGKAFPSYSQFRYRVVKKHGIEAIRQIRFGDSRGRREKTFDEGTFRENVANLMERVEMDGYYCKERPRGYLDGLTLDSLCCVTMRDVLSGKKVGIGFSMGAERKSAYDMALFCAAIPKVFFCRLFGMEISAEDWISEGLPATRILDRGPGIGKSSNKENLSDYGEVEWAPAYSGQSKATIESSHPRTMKKEGQPTFLQSDKTPIELARQEIRRLIDYNMGTLVEPRLHPHPDMIDLEPSPIAQWEFFEKRGRNDAITISIDEAVRRYLSPVEVVFNRRCVCLEGVIEYGADELKKSRDFQRVKRAANGNVTLKAWVLSFCLRYIWVEFNGKILMLEAQLKYLDNDELLDISLSDLGVWKDRRAAALSDLRGQQHAVRLETMQSYEEE